MGGISMPTRFNKESVLAAMAINSAASKIKVAELYGSASGIGWGTGRHPSELPRVDFEQVCEHVRLARLQGFRFNYIINSVCYGNKEYNNESIKELINLIGNCVDSGVDVITIANPFLIQLISRNFPKITVNASVIAGIKNIKNAHFFNNSGAKRITIHTDINRDLNLLKQFRNKLNCELEILLNRSCLLGCPLEHYHYCVLGHGSDDIKLDSWINYCTLSCTLIKLRNPHEIFRSGWIRPRDLERYENLGIDFYKIVGRELNISTIAKITNIYCHLKSVPDFGEIFKVAGLVKLPSGRIVSTLFHINGCDNDEDFEKRFQPVERCMVDCGSCNVCSELASKYLHIEEKEAFIKIFKSDLKASVTLLSEQDRKGINKWTEKVE